MTMEMPPHLEKLLKRDEQLSEVEAEAIYAQGKEAVVFSLLALTAHIAALRKASKPSASTPSGMTAPNEKPSRKGNGKKRPGRKQGHDGARRPSAPKIDRTVEHPLTHCPHCGTPLGDPCEIRTRIVEDIPKDIQPVITEHHILRSYCSSCKKIVESPVEDALPGSTIGNHLLALTAWLHYGLGNTLHQIVSVLSAHLHFELTAGGLVQMWHRLADILLGWYEEIGRQARAGAVLHADETGWRVDGKTCWLWCFTNGSLTYYMIDRCRGSPALKKFLTESFAGTLITDFWGAYNRIKSACRQVCLVHLFRELKDIENRKDTSGDWPEFVKKLKRLLRDALRLAARKQELDGEKFISLKNHVDPRLEEILLTPWSNGNARRLIKRLRRHRHDLFTFLDHDDVPSDNNHAEREVRPAVIIRKNIFGNRSMRGAQTQAILMSVYRTLKLRGLDSIQTIVHAVASYIRSGQLPPLPEKSASVG